MPITFRFRWVPFAATVFAVMLGIALGQWQTRRAIAKESVEATLTARESAPLIALTADLAANPIAVDTIEYRRVRVMGKFVKDWPLYLDNRPYQGRAGFYVLMPLKLAGSDMHVLVARGWVARNALDRARLPALATPAGEIAIQGVVRRNPGHIMQLGQAAEVRPGAIVQNIEVAEFAAASRLCMQPLIVEQTSDSSDALIRDWPRPSTGIAKHRAYAFQWYGLAAMAFLFFIVTGCRRGTK